MKILALNSGSNSLKFEIVNLQPGDINREGSTEFGQTLLSGSYDNVGKQHGTFSLLDGAKALSKEDQDTRDYGHAAELLCDWLSRGEGRRNGVQSFSEIERVGHRVVHGADLFDGPAAITEAVIRQIEELEDLAPLHNKSALEVIRAVRARMRESMPMVASFDTVFHRTIPDSAALYALPPDLAKRHKIRRYGFHGLSHGYLVRRFAQLTEKDASQMKLVTMHLEGGSSAAAVRNGQSVDTSMGFTPLEGLVMGTRTGDLDPAIVPYLMRKAKMDPKQADEFLNKECGLKALSGVSSDTRELVPKMAEPQVDLAIDIFCHRVRKYLGAYLAVLGGADAIVLGGGISENTPLIRERICRDLPWFGIEFDAERNAKVINCEGEITKPGSRLPVWVIPARENLMVAHEAAQVSNDAFENR